MNELKTGSVSDGDERTNHLINCMGHAADGSSCPAWVTIWIPKRVSRGFMEGPFLCG